MSLGTMLKEARKRAGLTQEAAANELYVSRQTLSKWETDLSEPKASELLHCLELYHLPVTALLELRPDLTAADSPADHTDHPQQPSMPGLPQSPGKPSPSGPAPEAAAIPWRTPWLRPALPFSFSPRPSFL